MLLNLDNQTELVDDHSPMSGYKASWDVDDDDNNDDDDNKSEDAVNDSLTPTQLLSLAIKKRRVLFSHKERDYRCELLHTALIQSLCKHLGESRANRRHQRKRRRGRRSRSPRQAKYAKCEYTEGESDPVSVSGSCDMALGDGVDAAVPATSSSFTDHIQLPTAAPSLMELDKVSVIHDLADDHHQQQTDSTVSYSFGGIDDPDPFGLDDLFAQMLSHHHQQPQRKGITTRG